MDGFSAQCTGTLCRNQTIKTHIHVIYAAYTVHGYTFFVVVLVFLPSVH